MYPSTPAPPRTWVQAPLWVQLGVPVDLSTTDQDGLNPHQLGDGEGQGEAGIGGTVQLHLACLSPVDAGQQQHGRAAAQAQQSGHQLLLDGNDAAEILCGCWQSSLAGCHQACHTACTLSLSPGDAVSSQQNNVPGWTEISADAAPVLRVPGLCHAAWYMAGWGLPVLLSS